MLPNTMANFVKQLISETQDGIVSWDYYSDEDKVVTEYQGMKITLDYAFDFNQEIGVQRFNIVQSDGRHFFFAVGQYDSGYTLLKQLYNEAQASDFKY
ncbi:TPA: hypothetical protein L9R79_005180 [Klebsiella pneumoniae]|uniref:hypothetical protein n=1 Tax=Klebsiella pneumoniae TaxID=573 RepID=UPI00028307BB|nr:hypothetical protein [Klebsiella pneumoniae]EKB83978.1 hypothetical protein HMPREF1308_03151 [Klebsiella pneumoniae subsp. pneumoniae WGLW5]EKV5381883.1 hypothetical protein [Klebsiella pneumoniae]EKX0552775.1 hypothetical protein [Klebsiella pneumoniae]EKX0556172.1 hypothetical protein [Klebsiella pneumoniae]EKX0557824.1 hypothetical protein [Klebsiella pneumoniae]